MDERPLIRSRCAKVDVGATVQTKEPSTMKVTRIGLDLAKNVFQVHGADAEEACLATTGR